VSVTNTGAVDVTVARGSQSFTLRPNQSRTVYPEGSAVTATVASGTGQVTTTAQAAQVTQAQQVAANTRPSPGYPPPMPKTVTSGSQVWYQNNLGLAGGNLANVRFDLAGTAFEVGLREYATNGLSFRIKVDGVYVTDVMTPTANSGNVVYVKCAFDSAAQRTIQFEMFSGQFGAADQASNQGFIGVASGDAITKTSRPVRGKLLVIGDSIPYGSTGTSQWRAFPKVLADLLGCEEVAFDTVGASAGITAASPSTSTLTGGACGWLRHRPRGRQP
jgi:hypothetical protein